MPNKKKKTVVFEIDFLVEIRMKNIKFLLHSTIHIFNMRVEIKSGKTNEITRRQFLHPTIERKSFESIYNLM
jgi:hypothetical protein